MQRYLERSVEEYSVLTSLNDGRPTGEYKDGEEAGGSVKTASGGKGGKKGKGKKGEGKNKSDSSSFVAGVTGGAS